MSSETSSTAEAEDFFPIRIQEVLTETDDTASFVLQFPENERFRYRAGQFLTFRVPWRGVYLKRSYSLSSSPDTNEAPKVTVKRVADGRVSNWFHDSLQPRDEIWATPPAGALLPRKARYSLGAAERRQRNHAGDFVIEKRFA